MEICDRTDSQMAALLAVDDDMVAIFLSLLTSFNHC